MVTVTVSLPSTVSPLGVGVSPTDPFAINSPITADYIDPVTNEYLSMTQGMDPIDAQVIIAIKTIKGSGDAVANDGTRLRDLDKIRPNIEFQIEGEVRNALERLVRNRDIRIDKFVFDVDKPNDTVSFQLDYINLRAKAGTRKSLSIVVRS
jgi:hypothetical protein